MWLLLKSTRIMHGHINRIACDDTTLEPWKRFRKFLYLKNIQIDFWGYEDVLTYTKKNILILKTAEFLRIHLSFWFRNLPPRPLKTLVINSFV